jgi:signal transduction histidine kinase
MPESKSPERIFMHDIATPTAVALGMIDLILDDSQSGAAVLPEAAVKRLEKAQSALLKLQEMMAARRKTLMESGGN